MRKTILFLIMIVFLAGVALAGERFTACPYGIEVTAKEFKAENKAALEKALIQSLRETKIFALVPVDEIKKLTAKMTPKKTSPYEKAKEVAEFCGIDFLISGKVEGGKKTDEALLEELFNEDGKISQLLSLNLTIYDVAGRKNAFDKKIELADPADYGKAVRKALEEFGREYSRKRGRIVKIKDIKLAINLGKADGLVEGALVTIYEEDQAVKFKDIKIKPRGKKIIEAIVTKVVEKGALAEIDSPLEAKMIKEGYYVEYNAEPAQKQEEAASQEVKTKEDIKIIEKEEAPVKQEIKSEEKKPEIKKQGGDF